MEGKENQLPHLVFKAVGSNNRKKQKVTEIKYVTTFNDQWGQIPTLLPVES